MPTPKLQRTWRLWLAYDGTRYCGWQFQPDQPSVEAELQKAILKLTGQNVLLTAAGRTDSSVHARGQVVSCIFESRFDSRTLILALASALPSDIAVWRADIVKQGFNAKRQSIGKRYMYRIRQALASDPFDLTTCWHFRQNLNIEAMQQAATYLIGEHDFESFRSSQCQAEHARRYVWMVDVQSVKDGIALDVRGNAFCHNMVRIIIGTLVDVGLGKIKSHQVAEILASKNRLLAGRTVPARGLTLQEVYYADTLQDAQIPQGVRFPRYPVTEEIF